MKTKNKLLALLSIPSLDGTVAIAAARGMFTIKNSFLISLLFLAGPLAIMSASQIEGAIKERIFAAGTAGIIATAIIIFAASIGPKLLELVNFEIIKIAGGLSILCIGLIILGIKIPNKIPLAIIILGIIIGGTLK